MNHKQINLFLSFALMIFFVVDVITDIINNAPRDIHFYLEGFFVIALVYILIFQIKEIRTMEVEIKTSHQELEVLKGGLTREIEKLFNSWQLTPSEKEVAWLILKGISYSDIAKVKDISKRTVDQHSGSIFKKSNSINRHEFVSGFIEEILTIQSE